MVAAAGAGPRPLDAKTLSNSALADAIAVLLSPDTVSAAETIAAKMRHENGVKEAVKSFHRNLPVQGMNCDLIPRRSAVWIWTKGKKRIKLSHRAASILVESGKIEVSALKLSVLLLFLYLTDGHVCG
jgi:sterol 3beta-glucosyltransferase